MAVGEARRREAYLGKARSELGHLVELGVPMVGNAFASVLFVKGRPTADELAGQLLGGPDGKALRASLGALGYAPEEWAALSAVRADGVALEPSIVRLAITTFDPSTLVACDEAAAQAVREAYAAELAVLPTFEEASLLPGLVVHAAGMRVLNLGDFERALDNSADKQRMWAYLKQLPPLGEPY